MNKTNKAISFRLKFGFVYYLNRGLKKKNPPNLKFGDPENHFRLKFGLGGGKLASLAAAAQKKNPPNLKVGDREIPVP